MKKIISPEEAERRIRLLHREVPAAGASMFEFTTVCHEDGNVFPCDTVRLLDRDDVKIEDWS